MIKDTQVAQFIATARLHLSLLPVIIDDSCQAQYKTLNLFKKERLRGYFSRWGLTELTVNPLPLLLKILTHSFLLQNSPFLGAEVFVFFLGINRLPDGNPCFSLQIHAKKITRTN